MHSGKWKAAREKFCFIILDLRPPRDQDRQKKELLHTLQHLTRFGMNQDKIWRWPLALKKRLDKFIGRSINRY